MAKKKGTTNGSDKTRSEATAAAKPLFNDPKQPQSPVTTDNLKVTIDKAIQEAFAKQEKRELADLRQGVRSDAPKAKKPRIRLMNDDTDPQAKPRIRLIPEKQKIRGRFKVSEVTHNPVEEQQKQPMSKVWLNIPPATTIPDLPRKTKPKVRFKTPQEKPVTPTGASINEIAEKLQTAEQQAPAAKPKIEFKGTVPHNLVPQPAKP